MRAALLMAPLCAVFLSLVWDQARIEWLIGRGQPCVAASAPIGVRLDPNIAPWWELAVLPGLGPERAMAIRTFSDSGRGAGAVEPERAFGAVEDLDAVPGIGPTTLSELAPFLAVSPYAGG